MKVLNKSKQVIIVENLKIANNYITRTIGLLGKKKLEDGQGLFITPCNSIHSCFMQFNFDAVFLDKHNKVKHLIKNMPPFKFSPIIFSAVNTLEIPAGTIEKSNLNIGDTLEFID